MTEFVRFSEKQFERFLWIIKKELSLKCYIQDVTEEITVFESKPVWEKVYSIPLKSSQSRILIFSSVDRRTKYVRNKGTDAVRFVLETKTSKETLYKHIKKHLRIHSLEKNMKNTIKETLEAF